MSGGDQEVAADAAAEIVDAIQELREEGVQAGGEDLLDVAVLQFGAQLARAALRLARRSSGLCPASGAATLPPAPGYGGAAAPGTTPEPGAAAGL